MPALGHGAPLPVSSFHSAPHCTALHHPSTPHWWLAAVLVSPAVPSLAMMSSSSSSPEQSSSRASAAAAAAAAAAGAAALPGPTDMIGLHIPDIVVIDGVTYYLVTVVTPAKAWSCQKRYSQFEELHLHLVTQFPTLPLPAGCQLPPKRPKALVSHSDRHFVEERRILLEYYSRRCNTVREVAGSTTFKGFFASDQLDHLVHVPDDAPSFPPDAEITSVAIPYTRRMSDHVLYHVELCNAQMRRSFGEWSVLKRANQFYDLDAAIRQAHAHEPYFLSTLPSPPSRQLKMVVDHNDVHFVEQRRVLLEHYMKKMIAIPQVANNSSFLHFCGVKT